jgi:hypothetical protein
MSASSGLWSQETSAGDEVGGLGDLVAEGQRGAAPLVGRRNALWILDLPGVIPQEAHHPVGDCPRLVGERGALLHDVRGHQARHHGQPQEHPDHLVLRFV